MPFNCTITSLLKHLTILLKMFPAPPVLTRAPGEMTGNVTVMLKEEWDEMKSYPALSEVRQNSHCSSSSRCRRSWEAFWCSDCPALSLSLSSSLVPRSPFLLLLSCFVLACLLFSRPPSRLNCLSLARSPAPWQCHCLTVQTAAADNLFQHQPQTRPWCVSLSLVHPCALRARVLPLYWGYFEGCVCVFLSLWTRTGGMFPIICLQLFWFKNTYVFLILKLFKVDEETHNGSLKWWN